MGVTVPSRSSERSPVAPIALLRRVLRLARPVATAHLALTAPLRTAAGPEVVPVEVVRSLGHAPRIAVFVPPPGAGPEIWHQGREATGATYPERVHELLGWSAVLLRTGAAPIPEGGVALGALLQRLCEQWPVEPERIALVGYGAGGLVARSAAGLHAPGHRWPALLTDVVAVDTPTLAVSAAGLPGGAGRRLEEQLAGLVVVEDRLLDVPLRPGVDYRVVGVCAAGRPWLAGRLLGELLWWRHRRPGRPRVARELFGTAERVEVAAGGAPLVNHPELHSALLHWLA